MYKRQVLQEETARQQMEIIAYRNQVNPHFLYNTLDCIRGIAYMHDVPEIVEISEALSAMFRYAVKGDDFVTLEKEITSIRSYATIIVPVSYTHLRHSHSAARDRAASGDGPFRPQPPPARPAWHGRGAHG